MNFKEIPALFKFTREQRLGIVVLFGLIILLQMGYYFVDFSVIPNKSEQEKQWVSVQAEIDALKSNRKFQPAKIYLFNPNFISDYKGYKLGMSVQEIDRLFAFRKQNKYVNSREEFQKVTLVSDSLLLAIAPFFKFPDWVTNKNVAKQNIKFSYPAFAKKEKPILLDINLASKEDLIKIYGIGEAIATRILKLKENLGGFVSMLQMKDVWGLSDEVILNVNLHFKIFKMPNPIKIDINNASLKELSQFYYFKYPLSREIVTFRSMNGDFKDIEDLIKIKGFPVDKSKIIDLYLFY